MSVEEVMSLFELITDYEMSQILGVFYGGYSYVNSDPNIFSTFFLCLCDYIIVYKKYSIINKISEINSRAKLYNEDQDGYFDNFINYLRFLTGLEQCPSQSLSDLRKYINNNYWVFSVTVQKAVALSTQKNYYKALELQKIKFEDLYLRFFTGKDLKFSYLICLLDELSVSLKIIYTGSKTVDEINPGCDDVLFLMNHQSLLYIVYSKEAYMLITCNSSEYSKLFRSIEENIESSKKIGNLELEESENQQKNSILTLIRSLKVIYKDENIFRIQELLETNIRLNETLADFICYHCWKVTEQKSSCGHALCLDQYNKSKSPDFRCPQCYTH